MQNDICDAQYSRYTCVHFVALVLVINQLNAQNLIL